MFIPSAHFDPLIALTRPRVYPRVEQLEGYSLRYAKALLTNIRLGGRGLKVTNTIAYFEHS